MIKLVIIDDHLLVLQGMQEKLSKSEIIEVTGAYTSIENFLLHAKNEVFDVLLVDLILGGKHAFELITEILGQTKKEYKIILISGFYDEVLHKHALDLGVKAFLRKESSYDQLVNSIVSVYQGNLIVPENFVNKNIPFLLTSIEIDILRLIVDEYTNAGIAEVLFISKRTVENHITSICRKLNVSSRIGAVREALTKGIIH